MKDDHPKHDPREIIRGFQQLLYSPTKSIGFFAGAGTSMSIKDPTSKKALIPGINELTNIVETQLSAEKSKTCYKAIKEELSKNKQPSQIEYILSNIRLKAQVIGSETLCGLNQQGFKDLEIEITKKIEKLVSPEIPKDIVHQKFAKWIRNANRRKAIEVFTTNYDYLFEVGFEREKVPYFDGFVGSHKPFFYPASVAENDLPVDWVRLWKVHGSLGWRLDEEHKRIVREKSEGSLMVFPSLLKYDDSRKQPYVSFIERLDNFLREDDSFLIICGYGFGDQHLNDTIIHALSRTRSSAIYAFLHGEASEDHHAVKLAKYEPRLTLMAKNSAVIGGTYGLWELNREPSASDSTQIGSYFDEDAVPANLTTPAKDNGKKIPDHEAYWDGKGVLKLGDFSNLVEFLNLMLPENS
ncbi:MAG: SIR2 family protein [Candidatus Omnitrophota bacterium]